MKTILIPTDYQASSLDCIPAVCSQFKGEELNLIFIHLFKLSDSISDVLMLSRRSREYERVGDDFYKRLNQLRGKHPQMTNVKIDFLYGSTLSMFKDFIEANEVDAVVDPEGVPFNAIHRSSIDPAILVKRSGLPVISANNCNYARVTQPEEVNAPEQNEEILTEV